MWRGVANGVRGKKETSHGSRCKFRETSEVVGRCGSKAKSCGSWCKFCKGLRKVGIGARPQNIKVRVLRGSTIVMRLVGAIAATFLFRGSRRKKKQTKVSRVWQPAEGAGHETICVRAGVSPVEG